MKLTRPLTGEPGHSPVEEVLDADGPFSVPGFTAVHTPGHTAGHVSFLLDRAGGLLFAGDAARSSRARLRHSPRLVSEDRAEAERSVAKLATLDFDVAVFGHGAPVKGGAVERFRDLAGR
jgi:glyoxylase-like metal-dependent hydrolase (beta-lactamase superfamily II)